MSDVVVVILVTVVFVVFLVVSYAFTVYSLEVEGQLTFRQFVRGGYRPCHKCKQVLRKEEMSPLQVPDGIMDDRRAWFCKPCEAEYLDSISKGGGPFTVLARFASGRFAE